MFIICNACKKKKKKNDIQVSDNGDEEVVEREC